MSMINLLSVDILLGRTIALNMEILVDMKLLVDMKILVDMEICVPKTTFVDRRDIVVKVLRRRMVDLLRQTRFDYAQSRRELGSTLCDFSS
jgi:hypothetical protein